MKNFTSFVLLAILLGCSAIDYRYKQHGLKAGGCPPALLVECKKNWDLANCALCGDGGLGRFPQRPFDFPFGGGNGGLFLLQLSLFFSGGGDINAIFIQEQQPDGTIILRPAPNTGPNIVIIPSPSPPNCPLIINCGIHQFFNERECRCRCTQQIQCRNYEIFNQSTCQCEQQRCPNTCSPCQEQNPSTCACTNVPRAPCPEPLVLDANCQCSCDTSQFFQCNQLQRLNPQTCRCECNSYIATFQVKIPERIDPPSITLGVRRTTSFTPGGRRRNGKRSIDDEMEGPKSDDVPLLREKRRRRRPGTRSTTTRTQTVVVGAPTVNVDGFQGPSTFSTETRQVLACPSGLFQNDVTCTCN